jgi:hypothetical protein
MPTMRELVYWQGNLIGYFELVNADMFNIYGKFSPANTPDGENFLAISKDTSKEIKLQIGTEVFEFIEFWAIDPEMMELKLRP